MHEAIQPRDHLSHMNVMIRKENGQYWMPIYKMAGIALMWGVVAYAFVR